MFMLRAYIYIVARITLFLLSLILYYLLDPAMLTHIIPVTVLLSITAIYWFNGRSVFYSYIFGLGLIATIILLSKILYGMSFYRLEYLYIYTTVIPVSISITPLEILILSRRRMFKPLLYILITSRLLTIYVSRFWRSFEFYKSLYGGSGLNTVKSSIRSVFGSQPYMVSNIMEYLYILTRQSGVRDD